MYHVMFIGDSLSELRSSLCERRLERTVLRPALLPIQTVQFTLFFHQVWRHRVKSLSLTLSLLMSYIYGAPSKARFLTYIYIYGRDFLLGILLLEPCISLIYA
jgi:hypothetical protein